jgi:hypothetical protein
MLYPSAHGAGKPVAKPVYVSIPISADFKGRAAAVTNRFQQPLPWVNGMSVF